MAGHADRTLPLILAEPCVSSPVSPKGRTSSSPYTSPGRIGGSVILVSRSVLVIAVKPSFLPYLLTDTSDEARCAVRAAVTTAAKGSKT